MINDRKTVASVHSSVDHLCGYAQHFPLIPCGEDLLSFNYAQRSTLRAIRWGACFYQQQYCKHKSNGSLFSQPEKRAGIFLLTQTFQTDIFLLHIRSGKCCQNSLFKLCALGETFYFRKSTRFCVSCFHGKLCDCLEVGMKGEKNTFNSAPTLIIIRVTVKLPNGYLPSAKRPFVSAFLFQ